jgi:hypothetical protein
MTDAPTPDTAKAMSLVGPINQAYNNLKTSYRTSLTHALELGRLLVIAHEAVGKKAWKKYIEDNCDLSYRTATVYMQLAKHKEQFEDPAEVQRAALLGTADDLSIRGAIAAVVNPKPPGKKPKGERKPKDESADSDTDLADVLKDVAADEVAIAISNNWEPEQREDLLRQQLKSCPPTTLSGILISALGPENTKALVQTLMKKLQEAEAPTSQVRRTLSAPATAS